MKYINDIPVIFILITLLVYASIRLIQKKKHVNVYREISYMLLIAYVECLLYLTLFPSNGIPTDRIASMNLIPFRTINLYMNFQGNIYLQIINLLGNIVVFIPIGIFIVLLMKKATFKHSLLIGLGSTLFIEVMQLVLSINGVISRSFDVDDLLLNTIGVIVGYFMAIVFRTYLNRADNRIKTLK
jgi:glycopeptide antibiotics resistance protein